MCFVDEGGWEKVSSRGKQAKRSSKVATSSNGVVNSPVRNHSTLKINNLDEAIDKSSSLAKLEKVPDYSGFVVERSMGESQHFLQTLFCNL